MQIKVFDITSVNTESVIESVNSFIRGHKVLDIDKQFYVTSDNVGHWSLFITYLDTPSSAPVKVAQGEKREKVDYKSVLSENEFNTFIKLRAIRKQIATNDAVPAYAVFTDAEIAQIAQLSHIDETNMAKISGIGERRIEKYGKVFCELYNTKQDEASEQLDVSNS